MAVASIKVNRAYPNGRHFNRQIAIQVSGSYPGAAGEVIDFTTMTNPNKIPHGKFSGVASSVNALPKTDDCYSVRNPDGYTFVLQRAAASPTLANFVLHIFTNGDSELASGAYPAALASQDIVFDVITPLKYN